MEKELQQRLLGVFVEELDTHLVALERGLERVDQAPTEADLVDELFRAAHSLKGAASAVGATEVASLCHELEERLAQVRHGDVTLTRSVADEMMRMVDEVAGAAAALRAPTEPPVEGRNARNDPPDTESPSLVTRAPGSGPEAVGGRDHTTVRVTGNRLNTLLELAGELITTTYRTERFVADLGHLGERLDSEANRRRARARTQRVSAGAVAALPDVSAELEHADREWRQASAEIDRLTRTAQAHQAAVRQLATGFAESVRQARLVAFTEATSGLARTVRELCAAQGKRASLEVEAASVQVDRQLVSTLHDVLGHAVRNAVVHGIEPSGDREAQGKPPAGRVSVAARLRSDGILVTVTDDGRGIDVARVQERAASLGLGSRGDGRTDLTEALFHPGLSTVTEVTEHAGRGVGLDAIRAAVEASGGTVSFDSSPGEGSRLSIIVPLTLSTLRVLFVSVSGETLALPTSTIRRAVRVPAERIRLAGHDVVEADDVAAPVVPLAEVLGWTDASPAAGEGTGLLVTLPESSVVLLIDDLVAEREVVLHAGSPRLTGMTQLLGTTQLEDGSACMVLSPSACARAALAASRLRDEPRDGEPRPPRVLLAEDTVTTRELERTILLGAGYDVVIAVDGQQAWDMLQARDFDIVVTDVNMPRMDGITLCQTIRGSRQYADLPVVLVTSLHDDRDRRRGLEAGADAYLTKQGFDRAELLDTLERLL
jgi:two-component system chemotaxis sensor kinase CheA